MVSPLSVPGLSFRRVSAPDDYARMNELANDARVAEGIEFYTTIEQFQRFYEHLEHCDLDRDLFLAELDRDLVGYARVDWHDEVGLRAYDTNVMLDPAVDQALVYPALFDLAHERIVEIAATHPRGRKVIRGGASDTAAIVESTLRAHGYEPVRHFFTMVRPTLDDLHDAPLPDGLVIRDVQPEHMEAIYAAETEAFREHWGQSLPSLNDREKFFNDPVESDTSLWRVGWDGEEVAGSVRSFISPEENERHGRLRGWVENISVGRRWRRRGLARALIAASFPLLRARGMTEAALGVDTENETGALRVYERCGFRPVRRLSAFEHVLEG